MRFVRVSLLSLVLVLALTGLSTAQNGVVGCDQLAKSTIDTLKVPFFEGRPGSMVEMPVFLKTDSIVTAFQFLVQYDTNYLTPVYFRDSLCTEYDSLSGDCVGWEVDSSYVDYTIAGRFLRTDTTEGEFGDEIDTITKFTANHFQGLKDVIAMNFLPEFNDYDSLPGGRGNILKIKFLVDESMPDSTLTEFFFYEAPIFTVDSSVYPPEITYYNGCHESQMTTLWTVQQPDSNESYQVYPTTDVGIHYYMRANVNLTDTALDPTVTLYTNPSTINLTQTSSLLWSSANADSVVVRNQSGTILNNHETSGSITLTGSTLGLGTYNFNATAYGENNKTAYSSTSLLVNQTSGNNPVVNISGNQGTYQAGSVISFTVTATNDGNSNITLTATNLPAGATFGTGGSVTGPSPVSGTFTWTPGLSQEGNVTVQFTATDDEGSGGSSAGFYIEAPEYDRLFTTSAVGSSPVGGLPGANEIAFPIDLISTHSVYGIQFKMLYESGIIRVDSFTTTERIPDYVVYDNIGVTPGEILVITFGLDNAAVEEASSTAILYAMMTLDSSAVPWEDYDVTLMDGRESVNPDPADSSLPLITESGIIQADRIGDVNVDKHIDVGDPVVIVGHIIGNVELSKRHFATADIIENDSVNVFDLVADINLIYGVEPSPSPAPTVPGGMAIMTLDYESLAQGMTDSLTVSSELPEEVAGIQLELNYDPAAVSLGTPQLPTELDGYQLWSRDDGNGHLKLVLFSLATLKPGELVQAGVAELVKIPMLANTNIESGDKTNVRLTEALLSTPGAASIAVTGVDSPLLPTNFSLHQNYPNPFNPTTTIEFHVGFSESEGSQRHVNLTVFNILGQQVRTLIDGPLTAGIDHQVEWDATDQNGRRVASGVYLYRLDVGDESETRKMLFLK